MKDKTGPLSVGYVKRRDTIGMNAQEETYIDRDTLEDNRQEQNIGKI